MAPYLVSAPIALPVTLGEITAHLRLAHSDDYADLTQRIEAATALLDGWGGMLGRCIMSQTWAMDVEGPGPHILPFPEASGVTATGVDGALTANVVRSAQGPVVTIAEALADEPIVLQFTSAMPVTRLPAVKSLIKLMVQREYDMLSGPDAAAFDSAIHAALNSLRWRRV